MNYRLINVRWLFIASIYVFLIPFVSSCKKDEAVGLRITSILPSSATVGTVVTVSGSNFSATAANNDLKFNGVSATVLISASSFVTAQVPVGATTGKVSITVNGTTASSPFDFIVLTPAITDFSPSSGIIGATVTITGKDFDVTPGNNEVKFNGTAAIVTSATTTTLVVTVPPNATTGKITVTVGGITSTSATDFIVLNPGITDFSPSSGVAGTSVTITGTNFDAVAANNLVKFHGAPATITSASTTQLVVTVPENATTGTISVSSNGNTVISSNSFTINSPTITGFSPNIGSGGISVVITGTNFSTTSSYDIVKFNGTVGTVTNATATQITATVPAAATTGKISVTVGPNTATSTGDFQKCSGSAELVISNLVISSIDAGRTSFNYEYDLTNVGDASADLTQMSDQAYVSTDNADNGGDLAASGWTLGNSTLNAGQTIHVQFSSNIVGGGTVDNHPYLVVKISGTVTECNTANNTAIKSIL